MIWTVLQTWNHAHRSGHLAIDLITMYNLCIIACGNLANVFFGVISAAAIHALVCYKGQAVAQILLPPKAMDNYINTYIIVAFVLKVTNLFKFAVSFYVSFIGGLNILSISLIKDS